MRGDGRIFRRGSSWWIAYCHRGKEIRESVNRYFRECGDKSKQITDKHAKRLLKLRRGEIGADALGAKAFIGPQQERVLVCELLDALETDLTLRQARSLPALKSHLKRIRASFGDRRAINMRIAPGSGPARETNSPAAVEAPPHRFSGTAKMTCSYLLERFQSGMVHFDGF